MLHCRVDGVSVDGHQQRLTPSNTILSLLFPENQPTNQPTKSHHIMPILRSWNRRRRTSLSTSSDNANQRTSAPSTEPSSVPSIADKTIYCERFRLRWVDERCQECAVCYGQFQMNCTITLLPCGHYFCHECMDQWFFTNNSSSSNCPLCRYDCSQPPKGQQDGGGNIYSMIPTAMLVGDSSTDDSSSSSDERAEAPGGNDPTDDFVCYYGGNPFAPTIATTTTRKARFAWSVDESDPLVVLLAKYAQGENFHLILAKAMQAKQAWERQAAEATTTASPTSF